jgi:hypothetical protein
VLVKYIKYYEKKNQSVNNINFDNLLIFSDASVRVIPENIIPNHDLVNTLQAELGNSINYSETGENHNDY